MTDLKVGFEIELQGFCLLLFAAQIKHLAVLRPRRNMDIDPLSAKKKHEKTKTYFISLPFYGKVTQIL